jgi:hypothetical protein
MSAVTFVLPAHTNAKPMRPFEPIYQTRARRDFPNVPQFVRGILDHNTGKFYERSEYTDIEVGSLARWLNDRAEGYSEP